MACALLSFYPFFHLADWSIDMMFDAQVVICTNSEWTVKKDRTQYQLLNHSQPLYRDCIVYIWECLCSPQSSLSICYLSFPHILFRLVIILAPFISSCFTVYSVLWNNFVPSFLESSFRLSEVKHLVSFVCSYFFSLRIPLSCHPPDRSPSPSPQSLLEHCFKYIISS